MARIDWRWSTWALCTLTVQGGTLRSHLPGPLWQWRDERLCKVNNGLYPGDLKGHYMTNTHRYSCPSYRAFEMYCVCVWGGVFCVYLTTTWSVSHPVFMTGYLLSPPETHQGLSRRLCCCYLISVLWYYFVCFSFVSEHYTYFILRLASFTKTIFL